MSGLPEWSSRVVEAAAVLGNSFRISVLARLAGLDPADCLHALDGAVGSGLLTVPPSVDEARFTDEAARADLVARLPLSRRVELHLRAARALAAEPGAQLDDVVRHWQAAAAGGASDEVLAWARDAADEAMAGQAFTDAERLYFLALEHSGGLDRADRVRLQLAAARASQRCGHLVLARDACDAALHTARQLGAPDLRAEVALTLEPLGNPTWDGDIHQWCTEALAQPGLDDATRVRLLARLTQAAVYLGHAPETVAATSAEALALAEQQSDPDLVIEALPARQLTCSGPDDLEELGRLADRMVAIGVSLGRADVEMWGRLWRIDGHWYAGRLAAIARESAALQRCADRDAGPYGRWHLLATRSALAIARAEFDDGERLIGSALGGLAEIDHPGVQGASAAFGLLLGHHRGYQDADLSPTAWDFGTDGRWDLYARLGRALVLAESGRLDEATALYHRCGAPDQWDVPRTTRLVALGVGAQVAAAVGATDDVAFLRDRLAAYRGLCIAGGAGASNFLGPVELTLGKCSAALDRWDEALADLTAAARLCRDIGAPGFAVEAECALAGVLAASGNPAAARSLAGKTLPRARALGMTPWILKLQGLMDVTAADPLSPREHEVAALVAEGLSNRAIAERLVISERTAGNHVQHILDKLGFVSRSQIAAWSTREGRS